MRKIKLQRINAIDLQYMFDELCEYIVSKNALVNAYRNTDEYYRELLLMDIAQKTFYAFRGRIENATARTMTISVSVCEALVLIQVIIEARRTDDLRRRNALENLKVVLHQQIVSIN